VAIGQTVAEIWRFFDFPTWRLPPSWVCDAHVLFRPPMKGTWGSYQCAKFGYSHYSSFDNMQVLIFCELGLKTPIHAPKIVFGSKIGERLMRC